MPHQNRARQMFLPLLGAACLVVGGSCSVAQSNREPVQGKGQSSQDSTLAPRRVVRGRGFNTDPVRIAGILYDGKPIAGGVSFDAPDDWLSHISVRIRNASSKPLVAGSFQLTFEKVGGGDYGVMHYIRFGRLPDHQLYTESGVKVPRPTGEIQIAPVAPGETVTISFKDDYPVLNAALLKRGPLSDVTECTIDYGSYYFTDGLRWSTNNYSREDPTTPGNYVLSPREALMAAP